MLGQDLPILCLSSRPDLALFARIRTRYTASPLATHPLTLIPSYFHSNDACYAWRERRSNMRMLGLTSILMALGCSTAAANAQIVVSPETQTPGFSSAFSSRTAPTTGYGAQEGYGLVRSVGGSS